MKLQEKFLKALDKWGLTSQILMLAEESSELSVACLHYLRNKKNQVGFRELTEEIADVEIMIEEIKFYLKIDQWVQEFRAEKLNRLEQYLRE